jgi:uncharacterized protein YbaP (TraB family)
MLTSPKTKAKHSAVAIFLLLVIAAATQIYAAAAETAAPPKTCLWRIRSENTTVYLQGSIHLLSKEAYPLPPQIDIAFDASRRIVLEVDLSTMLSPEAQVDMLVKGMLPKGQSLTEILSPETLKLANACTAEIGLNMVAFKHYKPWMFVMTLTAAKLQQLGFSSQQGIDWHYFSRAQELEKPVLGLETVDEQLAFFDSMVADNQDTFVRQSLEDFALIESELEAILAAWRIGNMEVLEKTLLRNLNNYPEVHRLLISDRNKRWMTEINRIMKSGVTTMVIVGAGHLPGKDGLISLLRARGYAIEQL